MSAELGLVKVEMYLGQKLWDRVERVTRGIRERRGIAITPLAVAALAIDAGLGSVSAGLPNPGARSGCHRGAKEDLTGEEIGPFRVLGRADAAAERTRPTPCWLVRCSACGVELQRQGSNLRLARKGRRARCSCCSWKGPPHPKPPKAKALGRLWIGMQLAAQAKALA